MSVALSPASLQPVDALPFREAMALLASPVHVVTTDGPAGRHGFTASAVTSVTDDPPTLLVCARRDGSATPFVQGNGVACVNALSAGQREVAQHFAGKLPAEQRFAQGEWGALATGAPVLAQALASFDCRIARIVEVGTHVVLFCEVLAITTAPQRDALLYCRRAYLEL